MTSTRTDRTLGELLVDKRLLSRDRLEFHLIVAAEKGIPLSEALLEAGEVRNVDLLQTVADHLAIRFFNVSQGDVLPQPEALHALDPLTARAHLALPVAFDSAGRLLVAVPDPLNDDKLSALRTASGHDVTLALAPREDLLRAIDAAYAALTGDELGRLEISEKAPTLTVGQLLEELMQRGGSDLHLTAGAEPRIRVDGDLVRLDSHGKLSPAALRDLIEPILTARQRTQLEMERDLDFSHPVPTKGRFRVNVFFQRGSMGAVMRAIPNEIRSIEALGLPEVVAGLATLRRGFVLVTGPTGAGKTTTLASLIDLVNERRNDHIVTIEDPIEFIHTHKQSIVSQREIGSDTARFATALKHALRQDPDVILVGEMRDLDTIAAAITAAETGHLVFATLHTRNAAQSIERMIDVFPAHQQQQVRVQLAGSIKAIVSQQLVRRSDGRGRVPAVEVMVATPAIRNLIREGKDHQIATAIQSGAQYGMQTMDGSLAALVRSGAIAREIAIERAHDVDILEALL